MIGISAPAEKRRFPRWSAKDATFRVRCARTGADAELIDFSHAGMGLVLAPSAAFTLDQPVAIELARDGEAFARIRVGVSTGVRTHAGIRVGGPILQCEALSFGAAAASGEGDFSELLDPRITADVMQRLITQGSIVIVQLADDDALIARIDRGASSPSQLSLVLDDASIDEPQVVSVAFDLDGGAFTLRGTLIPAGNGVYRLEPPFVVMSRARRRTDRVRLAEGRSVVSWPHALAVGERVVADVEDISPEGARVRLRDSSFPPPPGAEVLLHLDGLALPVQADVRHVDAQDGTTRFGLRLLSQSEADTVRLAREIERIRFPGLRARQSRSRNEVADLLRASGYLDLRESARGLTPWHDAKHAALSVDSVHVTPDGALDGHLSTTRIYQNTWMFHQLATLPGPLAARGRRALYLSATSWVSLLAPREQGHAMAYFDRKKKWHALFFETFVRWASADSLAIIAPLDRFEVTDNGAPSVHDVSADIEVAPATDAELGSLLASIEQVMPPLLREAMDLRKGRLATVDLCGFHTAEGLTRSRTVLAVREHGKAVAFALCEAGSPSLSLFNLLNIAHLVIDPRASASAQRALVAHVRTHYAERGTPQPIMVAAPGTLTHAHEAGLALAETMGCMVLSAEGLKQYRNFLSFSLRDA